MGKRELKNIRNLSWFKSSSRGKELAKKKDVPWRMKGNPTKEDMTGNRDGWKARVKKGFRNSMEATAGALPVGE